MSEVLRADTIGKAYGSRRILTAATLRARAGEIVFLVGRNGAGKSTLLNIAAGALPADHGAVTFMGKCHLYPRWPVLARAGLFLWPDRDLLDPYATPRRHLASLERQFGLGDCAKAADHCHVTSLLDMRCETLSSGERRLVEAALVLARQPACLLADEPFRHIAPLDRAVIASALRRLALGGAAVVVTGHDVEDLFEVADSVVWCTDGTTWELGTPTAAGADWRFAQGYLGPSRAARLAVAAS